jgi:hypothetical protein
LGFGSGVLIACTWREVEAAMSERRKWTWLGRVAAVTVGVAAIGACFGQSEEEHLAKRAQAIATCAGVWVSNDVVCHCTGPLATPTCPAVDCRQSNVLVLQDDGESLNFLMQFSASQSRFSVVGPALSRGQWELTPESRLKQTFSTRDFVTDVTCGEEELVRGPGIRYERAANALGVAILASNQTEEWTDVTY